MHRSILAAVLAAVPVAGLAQAATSERWVVTSTVVDLTIPGAPGFLMRMARGKSRAEHKCVAAGSSVESLLAPDPKARCRIERQQTADGRYAQTLTCPQKSGEPMQISRTGTYGASGFTGRAEVTGKTAKGVMRIILDQRAARVGGKCRS